MRHDTTHATCRWFRQRVSWHGRYWIDCYPRSMDYGLMECRLGYDSAAARDDEYRRRCVAGEHCAWRAMMDGAGDVHREDMSADMSRTDLDKALSAIVELTHTPHPGRLRQIEWEIHDHMERAAGELLEVGRCLLEVKDGNMVPEGEWCKWVLAHTGMSVRSAQRLMQAAREVAPDSALAKLSLGKITALLALPADQREAFAAEHDAESATVRELQEAVAQERRRREKAEHDNTALADKLERLTDEAKHGAARAREEVAREYEGRMSQEVERRTTNIRATLERMQSAKADADEQIAALTERLTELEHGQLSLHDDELARLNDELRRQSKLRADAQAELLRLRKQLAQGGMPGASNDIGLSASELRSAVNAYLGRAGALPHMQLALAAIDEGTRNEYRISVEMLEAWCAQARAALGAVACEAVVE